MSTLVFSEGFSHRRHAARRAVSQPAVAVYAPVSPAESGNVAALPEVPGQRPLAVALAVLAVHLGAVWYWHTHPVRHVAVEVPTPPITVELYKPKVEEPPKPLPQRKEPPPPPVVKAEQPPLPAVKLPDPLPPSPVAEPVAASSVPAVEAPPAPPPAPVIAEAKTEPLTQPSASAAYLRNPAPEYPDFAQEQGWEGRVVLKVLVNAEGRAVKVQLKKASGYKLLDDSALQAVQRWSFVPAKRGSTPVDGWVDVPIDFKLSS